MVSFFYSLISWVIALFFILLGFLSILIQASTDVRSEFVSFILEDSFFISLFGLCSLLIGAGVIFYLSTSLKKRYIKIKSSSNKAFYLEDTLFQDYMHTYWKEMFPQQEIPSQVTIRKNKVMVTADLPYIPEHEQKTLISRIEEDLKELFQNVLGYHQEYTISLHFPKEAPAQKKLF